MATPEQRKLLEDELATTDAAYGALCEVLDAALHFTQFPKPDFDAQIHGIWEASTRIRAHEAREYAGVYCVVRARLPVLTPPTSAHRMALDIYERLRSDHP